MIKFMDNSCSNIHWIFYLFSATLSKVHRTFFIFIKISN